MRWRPIGHAHAPVAEDAHFGRMVPRLIFWVEEGSVTAHEKTNKHLTADQCRAVSEVRKPSKRENIPPIAAVLSELLG